MAKILIRDENKVDLALSFDYHIPTKTTQMRLSESTPPYGFARYRATSTDVTSSVFNFGPLLEEDPYLGALLVGGVEPTAGLSNTVLSIFAKTPLLDAVSPLDIADITLWYMGEVPETEWSKYPHVPFRIVLRGSFILGIQDFPHPGGYTSTTRFEWHIPMALARLLAHNYKSTKITPDEKFDLLLAAMSVGYKSLITHEIAARKPVRRSAIRFELRPDSWSGKMEASLLFPSDTNCYDTIYFQKDGVEAAAADYDKRIAGGSQSADSTSDSESEEG